MVMNANGSNLHKITPSGNHPTWSPDGSFIAFHMPISEMQNNALLRFWGIMVVRADGSEIRMLAKLPVVEPGDIGWDHSPDPTWCPIVGSQP